MITAEFTRNGEGFICRYASHGHANAAPHGEDIYCAAVSAMEQMACAGLTEYLRIPAEAKLDEGRGAFSVTLREADERTQILMETLFIMLRQMARQFPGYVQIREHRR